MIGPPFCAGGVRGGSLFRPRSPPAPRPRAQGHEAAVYMV